MYNTSIRLDQVHRIINIIRDRSLESRRIYTVVFRYKPLIEWHENLKYKIAKHFPKQFAEILESYLSGRLFRVKYENEYSERVKENQRWRVS